MGERNSGGAVQGMKNTFVQSGEKRAGYRELFVRLNLLMSDDTPGKVCI